MSWLASRVAARRLIAAALLVTASAAAADILVVRSLGPSAKSFPPGKRLAETARLTLKANDQLVVLDGRGTRTLRGPGTFTAGVAQGATASAAPAQRRARIGAQRRARIGAVRSVGGGELRSPTLWHVDIAKSSNFCLADPANVTLWRADPAAPLALTVTRSGDGATRRLGWEAGSSTLAWPSDLPARDGAEFRLSWAGAAAPTTLRFKTLPQKPAGLEDMASSLIRNDCTAQLDLLIETVRLPEDAPAG